MKVKNRLLPILALTLAGLLCTSAGRADTLTGEVRGRVVDVQGRAPMPGVSMTLTNLHRGWSKQMVTGPDGAYLFIQLEPGAYTLKAEIGGYYEKTTTGLLVPLNKPKVLIPDIALRRRIARPTRQEVVLQGETTRVAVFDQGAPPGSASLTYIREPGLTAMVSLNDWALSANYPRQLIEVLPLPGIRSFDHLALFSTGVFRVPFTSGQGPAVGIGVGTAGQFSVNGLRGRSNNFTVDGSDNNDEDIGVRRQGFVSLISQSIESIEEFQVVRAGFAAEAGRNAGAMVNAVSRSGGSALHGSLFGFFEHHSLNARNFFEQQFADQVNADGLNGGRFSGPDFNRQQFGGVIGGPVVNQKLFYFASAERQRSEGTRMAHFVVPSGDERGLRINPQVPGFDGFVPIESLGDILQNIGYSSLAGEGIFSLYPLPNNPDGPFDRHTYTQAQESRQRGSLASLKTDWYISGRHSLAARYNFTGDSSVLPFTSQSINSSLATDTRTQNISLFLNSSAPRFGNALRFSYGRTRLAFPPEHGSPLLFGSSPPANPDEFPSGLPGERFSQPIETPYGRFGPFGATGPIGQLSILPYSSIGVDVFNFPQGRVDNTFQVSDFFTWMGESHTLKAGFDIRRSQLNSFSDRNARPLVVFGFGLVGLCKPVASDCPFDTEDGLLTGTDLASVGAPAGFLQTLSGGPPDSTIGLRLTQYDFFVQDEWKVAGNLTLNLGLRYELQTAPSEVNGRLERTFGLRPDDFGRLDPDDFETALDRQIVQTSNDNFDRALLAWQAFVAGRQRIYDTDRNNFSPRIGFAWDPYSNGKTVVRGGISLSYDASLGAVTSRSRNVFPTFSPLNLDLNFDPLSRGQVLSAPYFFAFTPTGEQLIRPGRLNEVNPTGNAFATVLGNLLGQGFSTLKSSNGLAFTLPEKEFETSYALHYLLSLQKQFSNHFLVTLDYLGTRGLRLARFVKPNAGLITTPFLEFNSTVQLSCKANLCLFNNIPLQESGGRPQPGLGSFFVFQNSANSEYHSLQASVEKRLSRGLQFRAGWTWSHAIDQVSDPFQGRGFFPIPQDGSRLEQERASANFDARHRVTGLLAWDLERLGKPWLRGWRLSALAEFQTGQPYTVNTALDQNQDGNLTDRLESQQGLIMDKGSAHPIRLGPGVSLHQLRGAPFAATGRVGRNTFRAPGIASLDAALTRRFRLSEEGRLELRLEAFNLFNRTHLGIPVRILESPGFGRAFDTQVNPRSLRLALKVTF